MLGIDFIVLIGDIPMHSLYEVHIHIVYCRRPEHWAICVYEWTHCCVVPVSLAMTHRETTCTYFVVWYAAYVAGMTCTSIMIYSIIIYFLSNWWGWVPWRHRALVNPKKADCFVKTEERESKWINQESLRSMNPCHEHINWYMSHIRRQWCVYHIWPMINI